MKHILFLLCFSGLFALDGDWHVHTSTSDVRDLAFHNGTLYCATTGGLTVIDVESGRTELYSMSDGLGATGIQALAVDRQSGKVYLGTNNGNLSVFDGGSFRVYTDFRSQKDIRFNKLYVYKGTLLIGTNEGIGFFAEDDGAIVYPFFSSFGDATNPFLQRTQEIRDIRDIQVKDDTLYILTRFFWAKMHLDWRKPLLTTNRKLNISTPTNWTTNGAQGDFAYSVVLPDGDIDTIGYNRLCVTDSVILGLLDVDTYEDAGGVMSGLNTQDNLAWIAVLSGPGDSLKFAKTGAALFKYNCLAADDAGRYYVGTSGMGVFRPSDSVYFWNGDEQSFSMFHSLAVDPYGNVYAGNIEFTGDSYGNQRRSAGIIKFDGSRWFHIFADYGRGINSGMNDHIVDSYGRLFGTFADTMGNHGLIIFDNPFLPSDTVIRLSGRFDTVFIDSAIYGVSFRDTLISDSVVSGPYRYRRPYKLGPVDCSHQVVLNCDPEFYSFKSMFIPTAVTFDMHDNLYFSMSENKWNGQDPACGTGGHPWEHPGGIRVLRDHSRIDEIRTGRYAINLTNYNGQGPKSGFRQIGRTLVPNNEVQNDGHYNSIAVDSAGNIWAVGLSKPRMNIYGLKKDLSTADTLIYDSTDAIIALLARTGQSRQPECWKGLEAHMGAKTVKFARADLFGDIWIGTTRGLFYYSEGIPAGNFGNCRGKWRYFLSDISINDVAFDSLNNIWIATDDKGLKMLYYNTAKYYSDTCELCVGDRSGIKYDSFDKSSGLMSERVLSVAVHRRTGKVFAGFENGLQEYESGIRAAYQVAKGYAYPVLVRGYGRITFNAMENGSAIHVYTLSGQLVFSKWLDSFHSSYAWNTMNEDQKYVASGVYLYRFVSPNNSTKVGKFAIAR
jgi:hypothetical protein